MPQTAVTESKEEAFDFLFAQFVRQLGSVRTAAESELRGIEIFRDPVKTPPSDRSLNPLHVRIQESAHVQIDGTQSTQTPATNRLALLRNCSVDLVKVTEERTEGARCRSVTKRIVCTRLQYLGLQFAAHMAKNSDRRSGVTRVCVTLWGITEAYQLVCVTAELLRQGPQGGKVHQSKLPNNWVAARRERALQMVFQSNPM